jgi:hypothetical protein
LKASVLTRVARWYIFKPKIPNVVSFGRPWNGNLGLFFGAFGIF